MMKIQKIMVQNLTGGGVLNLNEVHKVPRC